MFSATHPPLIPSLWQPQEIWQRALILSVVSVLGSILLVISAHIRIPFYPVPMTMQVFAVLLIGMSFGARLGGATVLLYLAYGVGGLPVFAGSSIGVAAFTGTTGGYLVGFFFAAIVCGILAERGFDRSIARTCFAALCATAVIYMFGLAWLGTVIGWDKPVLKWGLHPFIGGDMLKIALVSFIMPLSWNRLKLSSAK